MTLARRQLPAIRDGEIGAATFVPHLDLEAVHRLIAAARDNNPRTGERNGLLIALMFDGCLRVSEALGLRPVDLTRTSNGGWVATVVGKGHKLGQVALSASLVANLQSFAYRNNLAPDEALFPVSRVRVHQIVKEAFQTSGVGKPRACGSGACAAAQRRHRQVGGEREPEGVAGPAAAPGRQDDPTLPEDGVRQAEPGDSTGG